MGLDPSIIRRELTGAASSDKILKVLLHARPIACMTWNSYVQAITAPKHAASAYFENLLDVACSIIRELQKVSEGSNVFVKTLARERDDWPGFISNQKAFIEAGKIEYRRLQSITASGNIGWPVEKPCVSLTHEELLREVIGFPSSSDSREWLSSFRPITTKTWDAYIDLITAKEKQTYFFVKHLVSLADHFIAELNPNVGPKTKLSSLQKLARNRPDWPGHISTKKTIIAENKKTCSLLALGSNDSRRKKQTLRKPDTSRGTPTSGGLAQIALEILNKADQYAKEIPLKRPYQRKYWDFHYIRKIPLTSFKSHKFWYDFAEVILDKEYGPRLLRYEKRRRHYEEYKNNLIPIDESPSGAINVVREWAKAKNAKYAAPNFVTRQLKELRAKDRHAAKTTTQVRRIRESIKHWEDEPLPCILARPEMRDYARRCAERPSKTQNNIMSPEAVYNQVKKGVLEAIASRLSLDLPKIPRRKITPATVP